DVGIDLTLLKNKLTVTGDYYQRTTLNMFTVGQTLPDVFGATVPKGNYANMWTRGGELSISWHDGGKIAGQAFHYHVGAWVSNYSSEITKYNNQTGILTDYYAGEKLGKMYGYVNDGYWTDATV